MKQLVVFLLTVLAASPAQSQVALGPRSGSIPAGVTVSTDSFSLSAGVGYEHHRMIRPHVDLPPFTMPEPTVVPGTMPSHIVEDGPDLTETMTTPFLVQDFAGISDQGMFPPGGAADPMIAVGPNHVVGCVNTRFRIWDKQGNTLATIEAADWYSTALEPRDWFIFDPKVRYDHFAHRWMMVWLADDGTELVWGDTAHYLMSVSDDDNPLGFWHNWVLPSNTVGDSTLASNADYEGVGFDDTAFYISSNQFHPPEGTFQYVKVRILGKAQFYQDNPGAITWTDFWDLRDPQSLSARIHTARPAITFGTPGQFFLVNSSRYSPGGAYTLWKLLNPLSDPVISAVNIPVSTYRNPPSGGQLGGGTLTAHVGRIRNEPVYRDSSLWFVHAVASGPLNAYASIRYLRLNPFTPSIREDVTFGNDGSWYVLPALMVDANRNLILTYSRSSLTEYIGAFISGRREGDPVGLSASIPLKEGEANFVRFDGLGNNRWGDYMGTALDPTEDDAIWVFTQYAASPANTWGTWVGKVKVPNLSAQLQFVPGWNMISVPLRPSTYLKSTLFPTAVSPAYGYTGLGYEECDTLCSGIGFWLRFPSVQNVEIPGFRIDVETLAVRERWNIVGSISAPVPVSSIRSIPPGLVVSPFYHFGSTGYTPVDTLQPGKAYWMRASQAGEIILSSLPGMPASDKIRVSLSSELPPAPPVGEETSSRATGGPAEYKLGQNHPNPFNPVTTITFTIPQLGNRVGTLHATSLQVIDLLGRTVVTLVNDVKEPGTYTVQWDASAVSSGVYFYRLTAGNFVQTRKMVVVR
jgi:hypothetical protein